MNKGIQESEWQRGSDKEFYDVFSDQGSIGSIGSKNPNDQQTQERGEQLDKKQNLGVNRQEE